MFSSAPDALHESKPSSRVEFYLSAQAPEQSLNNNLPVISLVEEWDNGTGVSRDCLIAAGPAILDHPDKPSDDSRAGP